MYVKIGPLDNDYRKTLETCVLLQAFFLLFSIHLQEDLLIFYKVAKKKKT